MNQPDRGEIDHAVSESRALRSFLWKSSQAVMAGRCSEVDEGDQRLGLWKPKGAV